MNGFVISFKQFSESNDPARFLISCVLLAIGIIAMVWLDRYIRRIIKSIKPDRKAFLLWQFQSMLVPFRMAAFVLIFRLMALPLSMSENIELIVRGVEVLILALTGIYVLFYFVAVLDRFIENLPEDLKSAFPDSIFKRLKSVVKVTIIIFVLVIAVHQQSGLFPEWMFKYKWWNPFFTIAVVLIGFMVSRLISHFFTQMTLMYKDSEKNIRLRMVISAALWPVRILLAAFVVFSVCEIISIQGPAVNIKDALVGSLIAGALFFFAYRMLDIMEYQLSQYVKREDNLYDLSFVQVVRLVTRFVVVLLGSIYVVKALSGKPLTAIFAGLGIGGVAIALAAQDTLKNLLGGIMIMMDKPFNLGERVLVDGCDGVVEKIGFRSTRVRTLTGHLVTVPNEKMAGNRIENIGKRPHIRRLANITITYDTPVEKVEKAVTIIRNILENHEGMHPDFPPRVFFNEFNDVSLNILVLYWYHPNDYWAFCKFTEKVNLQIMQAFEAEGIEFAFPTSTTYLAQDDRRPLHISMSSQGD